MNTLNTILDKWCNYYLDNEDNWRGNAVALVAWFTVFVAPWVAIAAVGLLTR